MIEVYQGDNEAELLVLEGLKFDLVYLDPPFNTGKTQSKRTLKTKYNVDGEREGFGGRRYDVVELANLEYKDKFADYYGFLFSRLDRIYNLLEDTGSILLQCDTHESHYIKIYLDNLFGRENFRNEIIWAWDYGAKSKSYWPRKHQSIFWYTKSENYYFEIEKSDRLPYLAPELAGVEKAARGKLPTDTWWGSIVGTNSKEKTSYPTQKPLWLMRRLISCHCPPQGKVLDPFCGSGTTGVACIELDRNCVLIDESDEAIRITRERLKKDSK